MNKKAVFSVVAVCHIDGNSFGYLKNHYEHFSGPNYVF